VSASKQETEPHEAGARKVSAVVIAQNEAERLEACVRACEPFADEVVVVDGGSDDDTVEVARRLGCMVFENPWPGYGPQRNFGAERAAHDWLFMVDADEIVGSDLAARLASWKRSRDDTKAAFNVTRVGDFMGIWLDGSPQTLVRLYDRRRCRMTDAQVHETVDVSGQPVGHIPGTLWHHGFRSLSDHVARFDRYSTLDAQAAWEQGKRFRVWRLALLPPVYFGQRLIGYRLYRKGIAGLTVCALWAFYVLLRELKLRELEWRSRNAAK
jgi:glycosyltransferase involved in cell wall biosynthesis